MAKLFRWFRVPSHLVFLCLALAGLGLLLANSLRMWIFTIDDAYITFRYSANLAEGAGPTFNRVPPRAEGYTSVLWMAVMAIPHLLNYGVISFAKLGGLLAIAGTMACISLFVWQAGQVENRSYRLAAAGLVCVFFGMLPETAVHAVSGMETAGYMFLLSGLALLAYLGSQRNGANNAFALDWLPLAALLAGLMRPEANLLAVLALAAAGWHAWQSDRLKLRRFLLRSLLLYVLPGLAYFLWRWNYFGVLLPLPFYIKTGGSGLPGWGMVSAFGIFALANLGLYLGLGLFGEKRAVGMVLLLVLPDLLFFLLSHPIMEYNYRFVYPLLPLLLVLAGMGLELLLAQIDLLARASRAQVLRRHAWLAGSWVGLLALAMFAGQNLPRTGELINHKLEYAQGMLRSHVAIGQALAQAAHDEKGPVLAVVDAGAMPYYSGWRTLDIMGLNDPGIALAQVEREKYIFDQNPDVLVLTSNDLNVYTRDSAFGHKLYNLALERGMEVVARSAFYQGDSIWVLARPGSQAWQVLSARFAGDQ